jgi:Protein of unknown function (DUF3828)
MKSVSTSGGVTSRRRLLPFRSSLRVLGLAGGTMIAVVACNRAPSPNDTIHKAYDWYVQTVKSGGNPAGQARAGLSELATEAFLTSIDNMRPELENNPVIDPATFDARIGIENVTTNGPIATARVILAGRTVGKHTLNVYLRKEERRWKIDDVKLLEEE